MENDKTRCFVCGFFVSEINLVDYVRNLKNLAPVFDFFEWEKHVIEMTGENFSLYGRLRMSGLIKRDLDKAVSEWIWLSAPFWLIFVEF